MVHHRWILIGGVLLCSLAADPLRSQEPASDDAKPTTEAKPAEPKEEAPIVDPPGCTRISKMFPVWIDLKRKIVVVDGQVSLTEGQLEMFACPKGTKEHESVVAVRSDAKTIHAGLLAVGAKVGSPVQFDPYRSARGTTVEVLLLWTDKDGKQHKTRAQEWIRNVKTQKEMDSVWVFAGSGFWTDEQNGQRFYHGDSGDLICVSNFPTATLDLPVESSQANGDLQFEAFKGRIPPRGTKVRMVLMPQIEANEPKDKTPATPAPEKPKAE